jgi:hypothetical protein
MSHFKHKGFILSVVVILIVIALVFLRALHGVAPPKLAGLTYTGTDKGNGCLEVVTDGGCYTNFYYTATGYEKQLASGVRAQLEEEGYLPTTTEYGQPALSVSCLGSDNGDIYTYTQQGTGYKYPATISIEFIPPNLKSLTAKQPDVFGCQNIYTKYTILVMETNSSNH